MIVTFSDFGVKGPYIGELELKLSQLVPNEKVIHLFKDAPRYNPSAAAHLLAAYVGSFPKHTVFLGVIDPGVGSEERKPVVLFADDKWYVGPGNTLFDVVAARAESSHWFEIMWQPDVLSNSFHGRDLFAPIAAHIAAKCNVDTVCRPMDYMPDPKAGFSTPTIIYIDDFGNCMTGLNSQGVNKNNILAVGAETFVYATTFGDVPEEEAFWYFNSSGLAELAVNKASVAQKLQLHIGDTIQIR